MAFLSKEILETMGFKKLGQNVLISDKASIYRPSVIEIGDNVRIDDFCILSPGDDGISIGNYIHIGCQSTLIGRGKITLEDFSNISSKVSIYSSNDDYSGEWMTNPMVPTKFTNVTDAPVLIKKHTIIGASSVILPGVVIGEACSVGSLSLVKDSVEDGWIVAGTPVKKIKKRSLRLKDLEIELLNKNPKVSVAISSYKFVNYIEQCINSIQSQITNFDFEIVVADDFSQDGTLELLKKLQASDKRIKILESIENIGAFRNIKRLYESCKGDYIAFLDGDDYYLDELKLQKQFDFLEKNPDYVIHSTGHKMLTNSGFVPDDLRHLIPIKSDVTIEDIKDVNYITFGKMFRNIKNIVPDWAEEIEFLDWAINFETLKHGKAKCEEWCSGVYRNNGLGMITSKTENEIETINHKVSQLLNEKFQKLTKKINPIFIISTHITDEKSEQIFKNHISSLQINYPKMIISNCKINESIISDVDYFIYSKDAKLFSEDLAARDVDLWKDTEQFELHDINPSYQKHALAILVNLDNALRLAKSMGFTHFFRIEGDSLISTKGNQFINSIPDICIDSNKKGLFYHNKPINEDDNISTHFFYSEIDFFLETITRIKSEEDYKSFLRNLGLSNFINLEEFFYKNLSTHLDDLIIKSGQQDTNIDFENTTWNQIVSDQNLPAKYRSCTTKIYSINKFPEGVRSIANLDRGEQTNGITILSQNYKDQHVIRDIEVVFRDGSVTNISHHLPYNGAWSYHNFDRNVESIRVYENEEFLYEEKTDKTKNYIVFK